MDQKTLEIWGMDHLTLEEMNAMFPSGIEIVELVRLSLLGSERQRCRLPWVNVINCPGHGFYDDYILMKEAYARVCIRLGVNPDDEDKDLEDMVTAMIGHAADLGREMFHYGRVFQKRVDDAEKNA
ncbi:MAG: hypothetical protein IJO21_04585 [Oscillospiraceae bacterium]|nr:hypothetical protein [Oscillospiraceae bacterium]MBQ7130301.1 hypothetical protein [Oscillospiraceae bacterium]